MKVPFIFVSALLAALSAQGQTPVSAPHAQHQHPTESMGMENEHATMSVGVSEFGSGTSWMPASTPAYMWMTRRSGWTLMAHTTVFLGYNQQDGPRGAGKLESQNWFMFMEQRKLGSATLELRQMLSAEPLTAPRPGFPELFQTGETYRGHPLVDHQHPHDVFSELAALLQVALSDKITWLAYGGAAGEPALGPGAFPHRFSASEIPAAPLGHHLQDSTHIAFGVVTTGFAFGPVKLEASAFNGREPDELRYNFDFGPMDSWSARAAFAPSPNWSMQYSYGHLVRPEALENTDIDRQTASVTYNRGLKRGNWATSVIWGRNHKLAGDSGQNSYSLESVLNFAEKNYLFTRLELLDRDELFPAGDPLHGSYRVGGYTFGAVRDLCQSQYGQLGLGAALTFYSKPAVLDGAYGKNPVSFQIFLRFRPPKMMHAHFSP